MCFAAYCPNQWSSASTGRRVDGSTLEGAVTFLIPETDLSRIAHLPGADDTRTFSDAAIRRQTDSFMVTGSQEGLGSASDEDRIQLRSAERRPPSATFPDVTERRPPSATLPEATDRPPGSDASC